MTEGNPLAKRAGKKAALWTIGHTIDTAMSYGYDFIAYPYLILTFGLGLGWLYATLGSIILCLGTLWVYDYTKQDWLGIETIKLLRDEPAKGGLRAFLKRLMDKSDYLAFVALSIHYDPFIVTVYMRRGSGNHTMGKRDWKIFWTSVIVANAWWGLVVFGVLEAAQHWLLPLL